MLGWKSKPALMFGFHSNQLPAFYSPHTEPRGPIASGKNAAAIACTASAFLAALFAFWFSRVYLFEGVIRLLRFRLPFISDRIRVRWLVQVLDVDVSSLDSRGRGLFRLVIGCSVILY